MEGRILVVDPGSKRLGIAISDPYRIIATPLAVILHSSMQEDCEKVIQFCAQHEVTLILVGQSLSSSGEVNPQTRHAQKLEEKLKSMTSIPVLLWDESGSTRTAKKMRTEMGVTRKKRSGHLDDYAAAVILQSYLDSNGNWSADE